MIFRPSDGFDTIGRPVIPNIGNYSNRNELKRKIIGDTSYGNKE